jgi:hypothetical protein
MKRLLYVLLVSVLLSCKSKQEIPVVAEQSKTMTADTIDKFYTRPFIKDTTNTLNGVERELTIQYTVWGCACANWITKEDNVNHSGDSKYHFFLEPINDSLKKIEQDINALENDVIVKGQFYVRKDFPKNVAQHEEPMQKAKVFRYHDIRIVKKR